MRRCASGSADAGLSDRLQAHRAVRAIIYPALVQHERRARHRLPSPRSSPAGVRLRDGRLVRPGRARPRHRVPADGRARRRCEVAGADGLAAWTSLNIGATARRTANGVAVPGFPNLFFVLGPNTALGHNSVLYMIESQARHVGRLARTTCVSKAGAACIEATPGSGGGDSCEWIDGAFPAYRLGGRLSSSWYLDDRKAATSRLWVGTFAGLSPGAWRVCAIPTICWINAPALRAAR
jgi:hypothetical protein